VGALLWNRRQHVYLQSMCVYVGWVRVGTHTCNTNLDTSIHSMLVVVQVGECRAESPVACTASAASVDSRC